MSTFSPKTDSNVYINSPSNINSNPTSISNPSMQIQQTAGQPTSRINNPVQRKKYKLILYGLAVSFIHYMKYYYLIYFFIMKKS